jgi:hypothetical protein
MPRNRCPVSTFASWPALSTAWSVYPKAGLSLISVAMMLGPTILSFTGR